METSSSNHCKSEKSCRITKTNEKKGDEKTTLFPMESAMTAILCDASGKMHHGILFDRHLIAKQVNETILTAELTIMQLTVWSSDQKRREYLPHRAGLGWLAAAGRISLSSAFSTAKFSHLC